MYMSYAILLVYVYILGVFMTTPIATKIAIEKVHEKNAWSPGKAVYLAIWYSLCSWGFILGFILCKLSNILIWDSYEPIQLIPSKAREAERRLIEMRLRYKDNYSLDQANIESYKHMDKLYGEGWQLIPEYQSSTDQLEAWEYNKKMNEFLHNKSFFYV